VECWLATLNPVTARPALGEAPASVHEVLRSPGQPLDLATRAYFEPRFGRELIRSASRNS
jgi:hypothetical protein